MENNPKEKRKFKRANYPCKIYILTAPLHVISCKTENIGAGGIRIVIDEKLPIASTVGIKLYLVQSPIECKGKVVWVLKRDDGDINATFDTGIEFYQISEEDRKTIDIFVKSLV